MVDEKLHETTPLVIGPKLAAELRRDLNKLAEAWALEGDHARRREIEREIRKIHDLLEGRS